MASKGEKGSDSEDRAEEACSGVSRWVGLVTGSADLEVGGRTRLAFVACFTVAVAGSRVLASAKFNAGISTSLAFMLVAGMGSLGDDMVAGSPLAFELSSVEDSVEGDTKVGAGEGPIMSVGATVDGIVTDEVPWIGTASVDDVGGRSVTMVFGGSCFVAIVGR